MSYFLHLCEYSVPYSAFLETWNWVVAGQHLNASHPIHQFDQIQMLPYFQAITFRFFFKCHIFSTVKAFDLILKLRAKPEYQLYSDTKYKNPAYGRHQIYWPLRIVAPIFLFPLASKKGLIAIFCHQKKRRRRSCHRRRRRLQRDFLEEKKPFVQDHLILKRV